jgi:hypothetical protein
MKNNIIKSKIFQILSNGSLNISYNIINNSKNYCFFEKDYINFLFNVKDKNNIENNNKLFIKYKNQFVE